MENLIKSNDQNYVFMAYFYYFGIFFIGHCAQKRTEWAIVVKNHIFSERRQEMEHGEIFSPDLLITK